MKSTRSQGDMHVHASWAMDRSVYPSCRSFSLAITWQPLLDASCRVPGMKPSGQAEISLRPAVPEDLALLFKWHSEDSRISRRFGADVSLEQFSRLFDEVALWQIVEQGVHPVGQAICYAVDPTASRARIAVDIVKSFRGQGLGTEAAKQFSEAIFHRFPMSKLEFHLLLDPVRTAVTSAPPGVDIEGIMPELEMDSTGRRCGLLLGALFRESAASVSGGHANRPGSGGSSGVLGALRG